MKGLSLCSPAKLNLFFQVLRKREDGYHEIASLMQAVSLADVLRMELSKGDAFFSNVPYLLWDSSNSIQKAVSLFRQKTGIKEGVRVELIKQIPSEAGLGGGSSNAASALWALNELHDRPVSLETLRMWAAEIGSDVPFFFSGGTAYCSGRGEKVQSLTPLKLETPLWIAKPNEGLSTPAVYRQCASISFPSRDPLRTLADFQKGMPSYFNDLEIPAYRLMPSLKEMQQKLLSLGFEIAVMTGSGSAFFCFGKVNTPFLEGVQFFPVQFLCKKEGLWYELPHF